MRFSTSHEILPSREIILRQNETHERISRWMANAGLGYHAVSSHSINRDLSRSASPGEKDGSCTDMLSANVSRHTGARKITKSAPRRGTLRTKYTHVEYSDDEDYWGATPFGPGACIRPYETRD